MTDSLTQKTFKIELEFTVSMDEITEADACGVGSPAAVTWLKRLQQALATDENALNRQMVSALFGKLQEYADYLAAQDNLKPLQRAADELSEDDLQGALSPSDFADLTRPLRTTRMRVRVNHSSIQEKVVDDEGVCEWEPAWIDLRPETEAGRLMENFSIPAAPVPLVSNLETGHYLLVRYLTRQPDGVHAEGRCTCQEVIDGIGDDETQAIDRMWQNYQRHMQSINVAKRVQIELEQLLRKRQPGSGSPQ